VPTPGEDTRPIKLLKIVREKLEREQEERQHRNQLPGPEKIRGRSKSLSRLVYSLNRRGKIRCCPEENKANRDKRGGFQRGKKKGIEVPPNTWRGEEG